MSGAGAPDGSPVDGAGLLVAIVAGSWHATVADSMLARARETVLASGVAEADLTVVRVPGAFELPVVAQALATRHDAVICLGVIIRGGTPHFEFVASAATEGCARVALDTGTPVGFGLLTCDDEAQALARAGLPDSAEDKGAEAATAALETAVLLRHLAQAGRQDVGFGGRS